MMRATFILVVLMTQASCDYSVQWEDHPYEVHWIDIAESRTLSLRIGEDGSATVRRVKEEVIAIGSNKEYVVAKRLDHDTQDVLFYYVEKAKDHKYLNLNEITQGPYTKKQYMNLKKEFGFPEFTKEF